MGSYAGSFTCAAMFSFPPYDSDSDGEDGQFVVLIEAPTGAAPAVCSHSRILHCWNPSTSLAPGSEDASARDVPGASCGARGAGSPVRAESDRPRFPPPLEGGAQAKAMQLFIQWLQLADTDGYTQLLLEDARRGLLSPQALGARFAEATPAEAAGHSTPPRHPKEHERPHFTSSRLLSLWGPTEQRHFGLERRHSWSHTLAGEGDKRDVAADDCPVGKFTRVRSSTYMASAHRGIDSTSPTASTPPSPPAPCGLAAHSASLPDAAFCLPKSCGAAPAALPADRRLLSPTICFGAAAAGHELCVDSNGAESVAAALERDLEKAFARGGGALPVDELARTLARVLRLPRAVALLTARRAAQLAPRPDKGAVDAASVSSDDEGDKVTYEEFTRRVGQIYVEEDKMRVFRAIRTAPSSSITEADLKQLVWAVADAHPGLDFLNDPASEEFRVAYVDSVVVRIMWGLNCFGTHCITLQQWRHSCTTEVLFQLDEEPDINLAEAFFSYNDFYVMWCLFWELDEDDDAMLSKQDLLRYGSYGLSPRVVDRVWALRRKTASAGMVYDDFLVFLLAEEDKQSPAAVRYWFHVLDCDGDGLVSTADMRFFYEELQERLTLMGEECVPFTELLNEFNDMISPALPSRFSSSELRRCQLSYNVISALTNVRKFIAWEGLSCAKAAGRDCALRDTSDWDLFTDREYRRLAESEEGEDQEEDEQSPM